MRSDQQNFKCECDFKVKINLLEGSGWLPRSDSRIVDKLARLMEVYVFPQGSQIAKQGELGSSLCVLVSGSVGIYRKNTLGESVRIAGLAQRGFWGALFVG